MSNQELLVSKIRGERDSSYRRHATEREYPTERGVMEHEEMLPRFKGLTFVEHIKKFGEIGQPVSVLDIGCGQGYLLGELLDPDEGYPPISAYGVSAFDYRPYLGDRKDYVDPDDKIDYRIGDAHRLNKVFPDVRFDIVVSGYTFQWLIDPLVAVKQAYRVCKEGGIVFLDFFGAPLNQSEADLLLDFWGKHGVKANLQNRIDYGDSTFGHLAVSMQRGSNPHLPMPFNYTGLESRSFNGVSEERLSYEFNLEKASRV